MPDGRDETSVSGKFTRRSALQSAAAIVGAGTLSETATAEATDPTVYVGSSEETFYAVDALSGEEQWRFSGPYYGEYDGGIVVNGTLYTAQDEVLYAFDAKTGEKEWLFLDGSLEHATSATVVGGIVYIGSDSGDLFAIDAETGEEQWCFIDSTELIGPAVFRNARTPLVSGETAYFAISKLTDYENNTHEGFLYAINVESGEQAWEFSQPTGEVLPSPTVAYDTVYIPTENGKVYAVDTETGEMVWRFTQASRYTVRPIAIADGTAYVAFEHGDCGRYGDCTSDGNLFALDAETGEQKWTSPDSLNIYSGPTVGTEKVYVSSRDGTLNALDADTGDILWQFTEPSSEIDVCPTVADGLVYVGTGDTFLYAVDTETGEKAWTFTEPSGWLRRPPTVVEDPDNGNSIDSRVELATFGHHDGIDRENPGAADFDYNPESASNDIVGPGFGVGGAVAALGGLGYLLHRTENESQTE